jgi:hypothetical protein
LNVESSKDEASHARHGSAAAASTASQPVRRGAELFLLTGVLSLQGASIWLFVRHERLLEYYYDPELLALTHLVTLGFLSSVIMGALVMLAPTALKIHVRSHRLLLVQYGLFVAGTAGMVAHFHLGRRLGLALAAPLVLAAAVLQLANFRDVWGKARSGDPVACHVAAALVHFVLAALLGSLVAWNKVRPFLGTAPMPTLYAHAHLAGLGWVTTAILGLHHKLMPPAAGAKRFRLLRFALLQLGTVGLVGCWLAELPWHAPFAALVLLCLAWQAAGPVRRALRMRLLDPPLLPLLLLVATAVLGLALALPLPALAGELRPRLQIAYGVLALFGWAAYSFTTIAFKLLPTWIWQERFQKDWLKKPVPGVRELYSHRLRRLSEVFLGLGAPLSAAAAAAGSARWLLPGTGLVLAGVLCFFANFSIMVRWKTKAEPL